MSASSIEQQYEAVVAENAALRQSLAQLQQQVAWFKRQLFGRKSEKLTTVDPAVQPNLLEGLTERPAQAPDSPVESITYQRRKLKDREGALNDTGLRFDETVPVEVIDVSAPELSGPEAHHYEVIDTRSTFRLAQRPSSYVVLEYRHPVLKHREQGTLRTVPAPTNVLERSVADVSFLAGMLVDKFAYHLPLYRQHQRLQQSGIALSRMSLTRWVGRSARLLEPIHEAQLAYILSGHVVAMDETPIKAGRKAKGKMRQAYFWPLYGEADEVSFTYASTRAASHIEKILRDRFDGVLLSDGYEAYARYAARRSEVTHAQCWAHMRRHFEQALAIEPEGAREALELIGALYREEQWIREKKLEGPDKLKARTERCEPRVRAFWTWCEQQRQRPDLVPSNPLSQALGYACARVEGLQVFLSDPDVAVDTNHLERALRPIPTGRKNWLFCWTEVGAEYVAIIQSLLATARIHGINPYTYFVDVLQRVDQHPASRVEELTPRRWKQLFADSPLRSDIDHRVNTP